MALLAILVSAWIIGFSGAMAPGPISTLVIGQAARRGFWAGPIITLGHAVAELLIVVALAFGLSDLLAASRLPVVVAFAGGLFLVWMGFSTLRDALRPGLATMPAPGTHATGGRWWPAWAGLATSFSNPYWFVWWTTVGAGSIVVASMRHGAQGVGAFYAGHILSDLSWNSLLAFLMASGRRWLPGNVVRGFLAFTGIFLLGLGVYFLISGLGLLRGG